MNRLTLLAAGALTALALAALPALASAGEYEAHCEGAAECVGEITGTPVEMEWSNGEKFLCNEAKGNTSFTTTTTTGTANVVLTGCREVNTAFQFPCSSPGAASGEIRANNLLYHFVNLEHDGTTPGLAFTAIELTYGCFPGSRTTTGALIGHIEVPSNTCNTAVATHSVAFERSAFAGVQKFSKVTTTGTSLDLIANLQGQPYYTTSLTTTWIIHWDHSVRITC